MLSRRSWVDCLLASLDADWLPGATAVVGEGVKPWSVKVDMIPNRENVQRMLLPAKAGSL
jgi:hypothetical protein